MSPSEALQAQEARVFAKVRRRLITLLMLCYLCAFIDRVNVGFASLGMNKQLLAAFPLLSMVLLLQLRRAR